MATPRLEAHAIADAFLAGPWSVLEMRARAEHVLAIDAPWLEPLAKSLVRLFRTPPVRAVVLVRKILLSRAFKAARKRHGPFALRVPTVEPASMRARPPGLAAVELIDIPTPGELASWLDLDPNVLAWFAGIQGGARRGTRSALRHYNYTTVTKAGGGVRLLEAPRPRLKALQRIIDTTILRSVPLAGSVHGFVRRRSALTAAAPHAGSDVVVRLDLADFFSSIPAGKVFGVFATLGYPEAVARLLTGVCTTATPPDVLAALPRSPDPAALHDRHRLIQSLRMPHLPQGAPTSPALANLCARRLDARLGGVADAWRARYSRYADDLVFSFGDAVAQRALDDFIAGVRDIAKEEGFVVRARKTRVMRASSRQEVCGVVVNRHPNAHRHEYERLKAIVHNCAVHGPEGQNRATHPRFREHLTGRVAHVAHLNPRWGAKLRATLEKVVWET